MDWKHRFVEIWLVYAGTICREIMAFEMTMTGLDATFDDLCEVWFHKLHIFNQTCANLCQSMLKYS